MRRTPVPPRDLSDYLLAHGRGVVTLREIAEILDVDEKHAASALVRLKRSNEFFSPQRGLYVAVPPQYRTWGAVPAMDFIDPMMKHSGFEYYVGLLSAAELHGAAHQRPQAFQVMADREVKDRDFGRVRVRFYQSSRVSELPVEHRNSANGTVRVASPEVTAFDLAARPAAAGGLSNAATVLGELAEDQKLVGERLLDVAGHYPASVARRLGWLLDFVDSGVDTDALAALVDPGDSHVEDLLQPGGVRRGRRDRRWRIVENVEVEPDL